jgi:hypothetical protein
MIETKDTMIVVTSDDGNEAIYVDGNFVLRDETVYACDIADIAKGRQLFFRHATCGSVADWPLQISDVIADHNLEFT